AERKEEEPPGKIHDHPSSVEDVFALKTKKDLRRDDVDAYFQVLEDDEDDADPFAHTNFFTDSEGEEDQKLLDKRANDPKINSKALVLDVPRIRTSVDGITTSTTTPTGATTISTKSTTRLPSSTRRVIAKETRIIQEKLAQNVENCLYFNLPTVQDRKMQFLLQLEEQKYNQHMSNSFRKLLAKAEKNEWINQSKYIPLELNLDQQRKLSTRLTRAGVPAHLHHEISQYVRSGGNLEGESVESTVVPVTYMVLNKHGYRNWSLQQCCAKLGHGKSARRGKKRAGFAAIGEFSTSNNNYRYNNQNQKMKDHEAGFTSVAGKQRTIRKLHAELGLEMPIADADRKAEIRELIW
ncbi:unnamed protein product, partial [Amoebophrya sp. A120]